LFGPTNIAPGEVAAVDFSLGAVLDLTSSVVHGTFTPGSSAIGFYYTIDPLNVYGSKATFYSDDSLNGGVDLFATFPVLGTTDTFLIGVGSTDAIYFDVSSGLTPTTVPEPSAVLLTGLGLVLLAAFMYRDGLSAKSRN